MGRAPDFGVRRVLLLQGPNGPFFRRFAAELRERGAQVTKVNLHAGDAFFFPGPNAIAFRGRRQEWPAWVERLMREGGYEALYVFGDGRIYHRPAIAVAQRLGLRVFVFEEGYLRPDWVTLEEHGVNGYSRMPRDPDFFRAYAERHVPPERVEAVGRTFGIGAFWATTLSVAATFGSFRYPHYRHHRSINCFAECARWVRGASRKAWFRVKERGLTEQLKAGHRGPYFLVALQVYCDYQLVHSRFDSIEAFIDEVLASFAAHAPGDHALVIKHHPMDRAYRDYTRFLKVAAARHGLTGRVIYVHDLHLPTLLRHARGAVMINSTVGLQALQYGTPVKVLGDAVYDLPGMTDPQPLDAFWRGPRKIDRQLVQAFCTYLLCENQANGSFAKRLQSAPGGAGLHWFPGEQATRSEAPGSSEPPPVSDDPSQEHTSGNAP